MVLAKRKWSNGSKVGHSVFTTQYYFVILHFSNQTWQKVDFSKAKPTPVMLIKELPMAYNMARSVQGGVTLMNNTM